MRFPDFLIIGGMKCSSTSLWRDLLPNTDIFFPHVKEPGNLRDDEVLAGAGKQAYADLYAGAKAEQVCGDASTGYSKLPEIAGCPQRAKKILRPDAKIIYLVREPISRMVSHHYHDFSGGKITNPDANWAFRSIPAILNWSKYAMQAEPWIDCFGRENVLIIRMEDYTRDRRKWVDEVSRFIGVAARADLVDVEAHFNKGEGKPIIKGFWRHIYTNPLYRGLVRPFLSVEFKERFRKTFLPKAPPKPPPPTLDTMNWALEQLAPDLEKLRAIMRLDGPVWDPEKTKKKFLEKAAAPASAGAGD